MATATATLLGVDVGVDVDVGVGTDVGTDVGVVVMAKITVRIEVTKAAIVGKATMVGMVAGILEGTQATDETCLDKALRKNTIGNSRDMQLFLADCAEQETFDLLHNLSEHGLESLRSLSRFLDTRDPDGTWQLITLGLQPLLNVILEPNTGLGAAKRCFNNVIGALRTAPGGVEALLELTMGRSQQGIHRFVRARPALMDEATTAWTATLINFLIACQRVALDGDAEMSSRQVHTVRGMPAFVEFVRTNCPRQYPTLHAMMANPDTLAGTNPAIVSHRHMSVVPTLDDILQGEIETKLRCPPFTDSLEDLLDGQFKLLRADLLASARDQRQAFEHRPLTVLYNVAPVDLGVEQQRCEADVTFHFELHKSHRYQRLKSKKDKEDFWEHSNMIAKGSLVMLCENNEPRYLATVTTKETRDLMGQRLGLTFVRADLDTILCELRYDDKQIRNQNFPVYTLHTVCSNFFAIRPVLAKLKQLTEVPFLDELLGKRPDLEVDPPRVARSQTAINELHKIESEKELDRCQTNALRSIFGSNRIVLVQGPPGCGKTFIGLLMARIYLARGSRIMLCCYTNHALDSFLVELLEMMPQLAVSEVVRIGGRSREEQLQKYALHEQRQRKGKFSQAQGKEYGVAKSRQQELKKRMPWLKKQLSMKAGADWWGTIREHLLSSTDLLEVLSIPGGGASDGFQLVGEDGKSLKEDYLWRRWLAGKDAGVCKKTHPRYKDGLWKLKKGERREVVSGWQDAMRAPMRHEIAESMAELSELNEIIQNLQESDSHRVLEGAKIIACTTWGAANYTELLAQHKVDVLIAEEAGEILEQHVLTALQPSTNQLILIGDHQQLRPKVESYKLQKESGCGYDLNVSLFERLVLAGHPCTMLRTQHRMRPSISALIRGTMYPRLKDAATTAGRANVKGLNSNVMFVNHVHPEERQDADGAKLSSKTNSAEAKLVVATVKYLLQQGYSPDDMVVLTPYLGQLTELRSQLASDGDLGVILDGRDKADVFQSGLTLDHVAKREKNIRVATVDNYQGEEANLVLVSLVRSNDEGSIGFCKEPERVNVMLSRARIGMVLFGNLNCFLTCKAPKGRALWTKLHALLNNYGRVYDGVVTRCETHKTKALCSTPERFKEACPAGGCTVECSGVLPCSHTCPLRCHPGLSHEQMVCKLQQIVLCDQRMHWLKYPCGESAPEECVLCTKLRRAKEAVQQKEQELLMQKAKAKAELDAKKLELEKKRVEREAALLKAKSTDHLEIQLAAVQASHNRQLGDFTAKLEATREKLTKQLEEKRAQQHNREDEAKRNASKERKKLEQEMQAQIDAEEARFQQVLRLEQTQTAELIQKHRRQAEMEKERLARLQADMRQAEVERQAELKAAEAKAMVNRQRQQRQEEQRRQAAQQQHVHQMRAVPQATTLKKVACVKCTVVTPMVSCVRCPDGHDMCKTCFEELVRYVATRSTRPAQGSRLPCPQHGCPADYTQINVGIYATPATAEAYNQLVADLHAAVARQEQDLQHMRAAQELPGGWIMANGLPWTHYSPGETPGPLVVKASTEEFVMCSRRFREGSMSTRRLKRVQRVQNPRLWMKYRKTCEAIELQVAGGKNEQLLFHATRTVAPAEIAETTGIDFRHSIEGLFGRGAYFAERSEYSAQTQYIHTNVHGEKQMFLAQVAAGNVQPLERHQRDREMKHPAAGFDSVRGHVLDPDYYALIVYEVSQSYPAYILTYE